MNRKSLLQTITTLTVSILVILAVRVLAFTLHSIPVDIATLQAGDRIVVNKLGFSPYTRGWVTADTLHKGDMVVFDDNSNNTQVGIIAAVPGDTITVDGTQYLIPLNCCKRCKSRECHTYMIDNGQQRQTIQWHQVTGKAYKLFHLPW